MKRKHNISNTPRILTLILMVTMLALSNTTATAKIVDSWIAGRDVTASQFGKDGAMSVNSTVKGINEKFSLFLGSTNKDDVYNYYTGDNTYTMSYLGETFGQFVQGSNGGKCDNGAISQTHYEITPTVNGIVMAYIKYNGQKNMYLSKGTTAMSFKLNGEEVSSGTLPEAKSDGASILQFTVEAGQTYSFCVTSSKMMLHGILLTDANGLKDDDSPKYDARQPLDVALNSYTIRQDKSVTIKGTGFTPGTYTLQNNVTGLSLVDPAQGTIVIGAEGNLNTTLNFRYAQNTALPESKSIIKYATSEGVEIPISVAYGKVAQRGLTEAMIVDGPIMWDWKNAASAEVKLIAENDASTTTRTDPKKGQSDYFILGNIQEINDNADFNSRALQMKGEFLYREQSGNKFAQATNIKFHVEKAGTVKVAFSSTGNTMRYLHINDKVSTNSSSASDEIKEFSAEVSGNQDVELEGYKDGEVNYLRFYTIEYEPAETEVPEITSNLEASYDMYVGEQKALSITATGIKTTYQWYTCTSPTDPEVGKQAIDDATTSSYTFNATAPGTFYIYCAATNTVGTTRSRIATVNVTVDTNIKLGLTTTLNGTAFTGTVTVVNPDGSNVEIIDPTPSGTPKFTTTKATTGQKVYHGSASEFTSTNSFRNKYNDGGALVNSQASAEQGNKESNKDGAYVGYQINIATGYKLNISQIASDIYLKDGSNWGYEYIIQDAAGNQLYKSNVFNISASKTASPYFDNKIDVDLKDLTGSIIVKFLLWNAAELDYVIKDFNIKCTVEEIARDLESPVITTNVPASINDAEPTKEFSVSIVGEHYKSIQWYKNTTNSTTGGTAIPGQTKATLTYAPTAAEKNTTLYFYAVLNNPDATGEKNATTNVLTVNVGARKDCKLNALTLSNGFNAFVEMTAGVVEGYYMAGETEPTVESYEVSGGATYSKAGNTITVTAEDGTTKKTYELRLAAVQPLTDAGLQTMTKDAPEWIKGGHWHDSDPFVYEAWRHTEQYASQGYDRVYLFVGPCDYLHIDVGSASRFTKGGKGTVTTYINGAMTQSEVTLPSVGEYIKIPCSSEYNTMIEIVNLVKDKGEQQSNEWGFLTVQQDKNLHVTYSTGDDATVVGNAPGALEMPSIGANFTVPMTNYSLYNPGYTMTGWTDGETNYDFGTEYPYSKNLTLYPVWKKNGVEPEDVNGLEVTWTFGRKGHPEVPAMSYETSEANYYVVQPVLSGAATDVAMKIQNGLFQNNSSDNAMVMDGTEFTVKGVGGATIRMRAAYNYLEGDEMSYYEAQVWAHGSQIGTISNVQHNVIKNEQGHFILTYTLPNDFVEGDVTFKLKYTCAPGKENNAKMYYLKVTYPTKTASDLAIADGKSRIKLDYRDDTKKTYQLTKDRDYTTSSTGTLEYLSSDPAIATVSDAGLITAIAGGDVTISVIQKATATYAGGRIDFAVNVPFPADLRFYNGTTLTATTYTDTGDAIGEGKLPDNPTAPTGQNFVGWYTLANGAGVKATPYTIINEPTDFYALFLPVPELKDGYYQLGLTDSDNPGQKGDKLVNAITWATRQDIKAEANRIKIWIPNGTYDLRELTCTEVGSYISLIGESQDGVVIQNRPEREGLHSTATLKVTGSQVVMQNLTLKDVIEEEAETTDEETNKTMLRGVCLEDCGIGNVYREVRLLGRQNTYYASNVNVSSYFENSEIHGTIDMIGGNGGVWLEKCQLKIEQNTAAYIAAAETTGEAKGFIFNGCTISNADGASMATKYYLGHGLIATAKIGFFNTKKNIAYKETGWGQSVSGANMSDNTAAHSSTAVAIIGSSVNNATKLAEPTSVQVKDGKVTWTAVNNAGGYVLYRGGERVAFLSTNEYTLPQGAATVGYTVATISQTGIIGDAAMETTAPVIVKDLPTAQECYVGKPLALAVEAAGGTITYQWYKSPTRGSHVIVADPANVIADEKNASYSYTATEEGTVHLVCKAHNDLGDAYSTVVAVTAKNPVITQDLNKTYGAVKNKEKNISIIAEGGATYQWYTCDDAEGTNPVAIDGATSSLLSQTWGAVGTHYIYCTINGIINSAITTVTVAETAGGGEKTRHEGQPISEVYDFATLVADEITIGSDVVGEHNISQSGTSEYVKPSTAEGKDPQSLALLKNPTNKAGVTLELNNRFAIDRVYNDRTSVMRWSWRKSNNAYQNGLAGHGNTNYTTNFGSLNMSILGLYAGDKVTIEYQVRAGKNAELKACSSEQANELSANNIIQSKKTYTVKANGQFDLYANDNNIAIQRITIETEWYATAEPTITKDLPATANAYKNVPRVLSVEAQNADAYQWYKNSTNSKDGATAIDGAVTNTYEYMPEAEGTEYLFCVVSNLNGSKASSIAAVTTSAPETITLDFINRAEDDKSLICGDQNGTAKNSAGTALAVYDVEQPYDMKGYLAVYLDVTKGGYVNSNGLTNANNSGDRPFKIPGLAQGDVITFVGTGLLTGMGVHSSIPATIAAKDNIVSVEMTAAGTLDVWMMRLNAAHIEQIIIKKKATPSLTQNINDKYFVLTNNSLTLTVDATGAGSYQWYKSTVRSSRDGEVIDGATTVSYEVPTGENGTNYYYCVATNNTTHTVAVSNIAQVDVANITFRDFELDVRQKRDYGLTTKEVSDKSTVDFGVIVEEDGTLRRVEKQIESADNPEYASANVKVSGTYENATLGLKNAKFIVPVQGKVKFSIGRTDNADASLYGSVTVTDANGKNVATLSTQGGKWASNKKNVDYGYYSGAATTLTFATDKYVPYFRIEAVEVAAIDMPVITQGIYNVAERQWEYTITANAEGATIYYTTDGTMPGLTSNSVVSGAKIYIPAEATIKAYAVCDGWYDSGVSTAIAPTTPAAKSTEVISYHNGATGDNVGTSYTVDVAYNGGKPTGDDGLKMNLTNVVNEGDNPYTINGFRINVNNGYRITGINLNDVNFTYTKMYVDGVEHTGLTDLYATQTIDFECEGATPIDTKITLSYEYADEVTGITVDGVVLNEAQVTEFKNGNLTIDASYSGAPKIVVTTTLGYNYELDHTVVGDNHVYTFDKIGTTKTITLTKVLKPLPVITFNEAKFYFGERGAEGNVTNRGYDFSIEHEDAGTLMVSIDGATAVAYTTGLRAIETVEAYYTAGGLYPATHVTTHAASTDYDKTKPFAAYVTTTSASDLETDDAKVVIDGLRKVYNVVRVANGSANPDENLNAADLVVYTDFVGSSDKSFLYVNTTDADVSLPNNVLNFKLFAVKSSVWNWHKGATSLAGNPVEIKPVDANFSVFNGVSFNNNAEHTITLWDNPDDAVHLQGLKQGDYIGKGTGLGFINLATCTVGDATYDVFNYFTNNNHTYVQMGLAINDLKHYNENVKAIVSNICEVLNSNGAKKLDDVTSTLDVPVITDNHDGTATIRTSIPLATIKYVALTHGAEKPTAEYISENGITLKGQTTVQYSTKRTLYAIAIYDSQMTAVSEGVDVSGSKMFKITRTATLEEGVTGLDVTMEYDSSEDNRVPYNQSFRKEGYSVKKWKDQDGKEYIPGTSLELEKDLMLTAVWEQNTKSVADFTGADGEERTATFNLLMADGAPEMKLDGNFNGVLVGQVKFSDGDFIDVVAEMTGRETLNPQSGKTDAGKVQNNFTNSWNWYSGDGTKPAEYCQIKTGTVFTFPAVYGMTVNFKATDLERDEEASRQLQVHRSYIHNTTLSDGVLINPAFDVIGGNYILAHPNYDEGGNYTYSGRSMTAELVVRESSMVYERASINEPKEELLNHEPGWNDNSIFMKSLSVTYPILHSVTVNLDPKESHVAPGEPTAIITFEPEAPKNTNGKFVAGMDVKMVVTPTYAQKYNNAEGKSPVPEGVTVSTTGTGVPEDGAVYTFVMPTNDIEFTVNMTQLKTLTIKSSTTPLDAGQVVYDPDYTSFVDGKKVTLTANPKMGYEFVNWTTDAAGQNAIESDANYVVDITNRKLTLTVNETTGSTQNVTGTDQRNHYAQFKLGLKGTVHYMLDKAILKSADGIETEVSLTKEERSGFPESVTNSAMVIPIYYTMYKEGYTLDYWQACNQSGTTINEGGENNDGVYNIGTYYYFQTENETRYIKPVFRQNITNFDHRTTEVDIRWDFRRAYFAQEMNFGQNTEIRYSTHATINRETDASGVVMMDVPITISTGEKGKLLNDDHDEWGCIGEGTTLVVPSGYGAVFTLATYAPVKSTMIDNDILKDYTTVVENNVTVYLYTYKTQSARTTVTLNVGDDFNYYKYLRAQLPSAEKVSVNTSINHDYMGTVETVSTGTKPDGEDLVVTEEESTVAGEHHYLAPMGSYVTIVAKRNRLYEFVKWVDGSGNDVVADGEKIIITTDKDAATGEMTSKLIYRLEEYVNSFKALFTERPQYQISYKAGSVATGIAPTVQIIEKGESFTLPSHNQVLYYEGHTLKYWIDEKGNKYDFGESYTPGKIYTPMGTLPSGASAFTVPDGSLVLSPVFLPNEFALGDILSEVMVTWPLAKIDGATNINFRKASGVIVDQLEYEGMKIDLALEVLSHKDYIATNATDDNFCTINSGIMFGVPVTPGSKIRLNSYSDPVTTTEIGRYRGKLKDLEDREKDPDGEIYKPETVIAGSTSTTQGALTAGAYTAGLSPEVTCVNEPGYGVLDILFKGDVTSFTSVEAVYNAISVDMPEISEVTVGGIKLGSGIYGKYSVVDLNSDKVLNNIRVNAIGEKLPEVKVTTVENKGIVEVVQPTVADPRATIIIKTEKGIVSGVYVLNFKVARVTGTPNLTEMKFFRTVRTKDGGVYKCDGTVAPNSVMELTFDRVMAAKTFNTAKDFEMDPEKKGRLDEVITADEGQTLKFTFWDLDMGKTYKFRIKANTLEDVFGNPFTEDIWVEFTVSNKTIQTVNKRVYNFVVTHKEQFDHSIDSDNRQAQMKEGSRVLVASEELIRNLDAAGIPHGTIDEAIAAAHAAGGTDGFFILVPDGEYQIGGNTSFNPKRDFSDNNEGITYTADKFPWNNGMTQITRPKVSIVGQSMDKTVIFNVPYFFGISYTSTIEIRRDAIDCYFQDLSFDNRYSWFQMKNGQNPGGQSVAFYDRGKRTIMKNVGVYGFQDSYASSPSDALAEADRMGRCYYENCTFAGTVDFICGEGDMWWEQCRFLMRHRASNNLCAPRQLTYQKWGYIYNNCTIDAEDEAKTHAYMTGWPLHPYAETYAINSNFTIGRPWDSSPAATYLNTTMTLQPSAVGWASMKDEGLTLRFQEYGSMAASGELLDLSGRTTCSSTPGPGSYDAVMSEKDVARYTRHNALGGGEGYDPAVYTKQCVPVENVGFNDTELEWNGIEDALCYCIFKSDKKDGEYKLFAVTAETKFNCGRDREEAWYIIRAANQRGGLGEPTEPLLHEKMDTYTLTIKKTETKDGKDYGWSTICLPFNAKVPTENAQGVACPDFKVFAGKLKDTHKTIDDYEMMLEAVDIVNAERGYVVYGPVGDYVFNGTSRTSPVETILDGNPKSEPISSANHNCYVLSNKPSTYGVGFYKFTGTTLAANRAWLPVSMVSSGTQSGVSQGKAIRMVLWSFGDISTGINGISATPWRPEDRVYDLSGNRIRTDSNTPPPAGIYIINGRKVVVK